MENCFSNSISVTIHRASSDDSGPINDPCLSSRCCWPGKLLKLGCQRGRHMTAMGKPRYHKAHATFRCRCGLAYAFWWMDKGKINYKDNSFQPCVSIVSAEVSSHLKWLEGWRCWQSADWIRFMKLLNILSSHDYYMMCTQHWCKFTFTALLS